MQQKCLLSEYGGNTPSRVRISLSPPQSSVLRVNTIRGVNPFCAWWGQKTVRINISLPEYKLAMIDRAARNHGLTRSAFLMQAAERLAMQ